MRGVSRETIFTTHTYKERPAQAKLIAYGLDFGPPPTPPPSLPSTYWATTKDLYLEQVLYETGMTTQDLAVHGEVGIDRTMEVIADGAEPKSIEELRREGFNVKPARKGRTR